MFLLVFFDMDVQPVGGMAERQEQIRVSTVVMNGLVEEIGQTLGVGVLNCAPAEPTVEVIAEVEGTVGFCFHMNRGLQIPLHTSAPGKAIVASLLPDDREDVISRMSFKVFTDYTISTPGAFRTELKEVSQLGYSIDRNEQVLNCHCIGVPVCFPGETNVAALWTTGPANMLPEDSFPEVARLLAKGADEIEAALGGASREINAEYIHHVVARAIQMMDVTLNQRMDMKQVAADLCVSYSWFRQAFKKRTGLSPNQYHMQRRIEKAKELLASPHVKVKDVSAQLGFSDECYFSTRFKQQTGQSPQAYRDGLS